MKQRQRKKLIKKHGAEWLRRYESEMSFFKRFGLKSGHRNQKMSGVALMYRLRNADGSASAMSKVWG